MILHCLLLFCQSEHGTTSHFIPKSSSHALLIHGQIQRTVLVSRRRTSYMLEWRNWPCQTAHSETTSPFGKWCLKGNTRVHNKSTWPLKTHCKNDKINNFHSCCKVTQGAALWHHIGTAKGTEIDHVNNDRRILVCSTDTMYAGGVPTTV